MFTPSSLKLSPKWAERLGRFAPPQGCPSSPFPFTSSLFLSLSSLNLLASIFGDPPTSGETPGHGYGYDWAWA